MGLPPLPFTFRARNRIIAGLARATLIVEAGLPSGTFSTADDALSAGREVWAVPGPITSETSRGSNRLIYQGRRRWSTRRRSGTCWRAPSGA